MASPDTRALWLPDEAAFGPSEAFIDDHEFCHLHALPAGSVHLTLPAALMRQSVELGWAESHPIVLSGLPFKQIVMVYAPRTDDELDVVMMLVNASRSFALGCGSNNGT